MNHAAVSRDALLGAAERIVSEEGFEALSIRRLAAECGVAVGTVYNYFSSKSELVVGVIEHFWRTMLHGTICAPPPRQRYTRYLQDLYAALYARVQQFRSGLLLRMASLTDEQRALGLTLERKYYTHMEAALLQALGQDDAVDSAAFDGAFTPEALCEHALFTMFARLKAGKPDCAALLYLVDKALYPQNHTTKGD